jgi:hypothetical protein
LLSSQSSFCTIEEYKRLIRENRAFGELDHVDTPTVNMKNVCHRITDIWFEDKTVYGKVQIMPTNSGRDLITIIRCGGIPGISSRALGSVQKKGNIDIVQEDLKIYCWDFVSEPSTHGAFMKLSEAKEYDYNKEEIKTNTQPAKLLNEENSFNKLNNILDDILTIRKK